MKSFLTVAVAVGGMMSATVASQAGSLVPGSGADFTPGQTVQSTKTSDDSVKTGSTRTYTAPRSSTLRRNAVDQKSKAEEDSGFTQRRSIIVPGSDADFTQ